MDTSENTANEIPNNEESTGKFLISSRVLIFIAVLVMTTLFISLNWNLNPNSTFQQIQSVSQSEQTSRTQTKKRNLSVWTANCCPTTQKCGMFVQDCCQIDTRGCNWFFYCYDIADDNNCSRVKNIVKKLDGYWAI